MDENENPNENYIALENCLAENQKASFREKNINFNQYKHKIAPWMTNAILKSIHR